MRMDSKRFGRIALASFFRGLLLISPIGLTVYVIYLVINFFDSLISRFSGIHLPPGVGLIILLIAVSVIGFYSSGFIFQKVLDFIEELISKNSFAKMIYSSVRDFFSAFVGEKKKFNQPVMVLMFPESGIHKLGFITRTDLSELGINDLVAVYFPHSFNFSGNLFLVPKHNIKDLPNFESADAMKFIVSGGITELGDDEK